MKIYIKQQVKILCRYLKNQNLISILSKEVLLLTQSISVKYLLSLIPEIVLKTFGMSSKKL